MDALEAVVQAWASDLHADAEDGATWVTLAEAEAASGASRSALRSWYRSGALPSRLEDGPFGPQRVVPVEAVLDRVRQSARLRRKLEQDDVTQLRARLAAAEGELERVRRRVATLERLLGLDVE